MNSFVPDNHFALTPQEFFMAQATSFYFHTPPHLAQIQTNTPKLVHNFFESLKKGMKEEEFASLALDQDDRLNFQVVVNPHTKELRYYSYAKPELNRGETIGIFSLKNTGKIEVQLKACVSFTLLKAVKVAAFALGRCLTENQEPTFDSKRMDLMTNQEIRNIALNCENGNCITANEKRYFLGQQYFPDGQDPHGPWQEGWDPLASLYVGQLIAIERSNKTTRVAEIIDLNREMFSLILGHYGDHTLLKQGPISRLTPILKAYW